MLFTIMSGYISSVCDKFIIAISSFSYIIYSTQSNDKTHKFQYDFQVLWLVYAYVSYNDLSV